LADHVKADVKVIHRICNEKASITPIMAVKLAKSFDTTAEFWLNEDWILTFTGEYASYGIEFYDVALTNGGDDQEAFATARYYVGGEAE